MSVTTCQIDRRDSMSSLHSRSILVVDDDPVVVKTVSAHLRRGGFTSVQQLTDPTLTLSALRELKPDMVLLDIVMPGVSGLDLLSQINQRDEFQDIIILMLSSAGQADEDLSYQLGALGFIKKPAKPEDIIRIITSTFRIANKFGTR